MESLPCRACTTNNLGCRKRVLEADAPDADRLTLSSAPWRSARPETMLCSGAAMHRSGVNPLKKLRYYAIVLAFVSAYGSAKENETEYYVAVAATATPFSTFPSGTQWHTGVGWHTESGHDAGNEARAACSNAAGGASCYHFFPSLKGGCVALALGAWRDQGKPMSFQFGSGTTTLGRALAEEKALSRCKSNIFGGKPEGTVQEWQCETKVSFCSTDVAQGSPETPNFDTTVEQPTVSGTPPGQRAPGTRAPAAGNVFRDALGSGGEGPEMVVIPAGRFRMGCLSDDDACFGSEKPVHEVTIGRAFALSKHEVTFAQWDACVSGGGCGGHRPGDGGWGRAARPVVNVSWEDAQSYVSWLSRQTGEEYRLPTEAEWEYAARAGTTTKYSWGNEIGDNRANCRGGCGSRWDYKQTAPVGSFPANAWGLHDMHGNVFEWVQDCLNWSYAGAPVDGGAWLSGDCSGRVLRGGSWFSDPWYLRAANRSRSSTGYRISTDGFRVARTLTP